MVYDGFWAAGLEGDPDNMNATKVQISAAGSRPAAGLNGVVHIATDTGVISEDNGSSWDIRGYVSPTGPGTSIARIKTGTYTGDGATSQAITGVGFQVKFVWITDRRTTENSFAQAGITYTSDVIVDDNAAGMSINLEGNSVSQFDGIIALGPDGFTVDDKGSDQHPNKASQVYNYMCLG